MAVAPSQESSTSKLDTFLSAHPEIQIGRAAFERLQSTHAGGDSFAIVNKPFENMVLHQEFDADTRERIYVVALINDQRAFDDYKQNCGTTSDEDRCDCAENQGPDHLIYERVVEYKIADCKKHEGEPDPNCSACWPILCGSKCTP
ncbi:hypothetical protein AA0119_g12797 [Alternaria tenuissima]|uniref:Uncharacterized protein n=2 Tax=Alternaria alternata complex TaxID=187734 RepID=A0A4Q4MZN3_ALTAL|nr:hypothetical protein AA0115_g12709 [Alternaria tenuissima]RYN63450.1 hypothetical protein AA0117_g12778 [Alternaria alternata]RYN26134.1 hypothetical protein AA0114_g12641 [Alternaria tenuissima]RYN86539.1 hypothetical protein AA0119_g12797 [Alternaria tenuissima]RYO03925.1 hypothetical protein AA0121_g12983 [Alternaria tenuissima]